MDTIHEEEVCGYEFRVSKLEDRHFQIASCCQLCKRWFPVIATDYPGYPNRLNGRWVAAFDLRLLRRWCSESCKQKAKRRSSVR